ncbi:MAG: Spy/CpxP family protein refolding chaperone [Polyangiaceae bacterium]
MISNRVRWLSLVLPLTLSLGAFGCDNRAPSSETDEADESAEQAIEQGQGSEVASPNAAAQPDRAGRGGHRMERGMRHGQPGPGGLLHAALMNLDLDEARQTAIRAEIDALEAERPKFEDNAEARQALADAVRSGNASEAELVRLAAAARPAPPSEPPARLATALTKLHDMLSAEERQALVDAVSKEGPRGPGGPGCDDPAGPPPGADADAPDAPDAADARGPARMGHGPMRGGPMGGPGMMMLGGLDLSDAQHAQIKAIFEENRPSDAEMEAHRAQREAHRAEREARLAMFAADSFDAAKFLERPAGFEPFAGKGDVMAKTLAKVIPILTAEQRATLADRIQQGPMEHGPGKAKHAGKNGKFRARGQNAQGTAL